MTQIVPARVVLIEDHAMVRQLFAHVIKAELGLTLAADCTTVADGAAALLKEQPNLAIVDWMLPDGSGFDLVRQCGPQLARTRWLFVTSNEQGQLLREAASLGVHGFVMKRASLGTLRTAITKVLAGEKFYCPDSSRLLVENLVDAGASAAPFGRSRIEGPRANSEDAAGPEMKPGAVFLSYASQDAATVKKLRDALEAAGIEVWFDQRRLEGGDDFDQQIKRHIRACSLFLPVISATTQARHEGYFRLEWALAVERAKLIAETIPFILPIAIDHVSDQGALVPERFLQVQWIRLPGGAATPEFVERMVRLIRDYQKRERDVF